MTTKVPSSAAKRDRPTFQCGPELLVDGSIRDDTSCPRLLVRLPDLERWLGGALPGEALDYHRGFLALDRVVPGSRLSKEDAEELDRVATAALAAAEAGRVHLLQRRHGVGDYSYHVVIARRRAAGALRHGGP